MNSKKPKTNWTRITIAGVASVLAQSAYSNQPVIGTGNLYQNSTSYENAAFNYATATTGGGEAGNEIVLAGSSANYLITSFSFQYDFLGAGYSTTSYGTGNTAGVTADVKFYANNGSPPVSGYAPPGTVLYNSGPFNLGSFTYGSTENFPLSAINGGLGAVVPQDFTWTVTFSGLTGGEVAGLSLYDNATVGANYGDAWVNDAWQLDATVGTHPNTVPLEFGAVFNGSAVPDSSSLTLEALSLVASLGWMKRFQRRA